MCTLSHIMEAELLFQLQSTGSPTVIITCCQDGPALPTYNLQHERFPQQPAKPAQTPASMASNNLRSNHCNIFRNDFFNNLVVASGCL